MIKLLGEPHVCHMRLVLSECFLLLPTSRLNPGVRYTPVLAFPIHLEVIWTGCTARVGIGYDAMSIERLRHCKAQLILLYCSVVYSIWWAAMTQPSTSVWPKPIPSVALYCIVAARPMPNLP